MAIAFGASFTANSSKTSSTTIAVTTGVAVASGSLVVVFAGCDNLSATTPTASFTDSVGGNTWTVLSTATSNSATAAGGQVVHLAVSKLTNALLSTSTITCTLSGAVTVRTIEGAYFTGADATQRGTAGNASGTTTTWSASVTGGLAGDLVLGAITTQNNAAITGDTDTTNGTWGSLGAINTTGGGAAANIALLGQYKILTADGTQTWNGSGLNTAGSSYSYAILRPTPVTLSRTATGSGTGTQNGVDLVVSIRTATGSGTGSQTATGARVVARTAAGSGTGTESSSGLISKTRTATGSGTGTQTATGLHVAPRTATGSGAGTQTATGFKTVAKTAIGSGIGTSTADTLHNNIRSASGTGGASPNATATGLRTVLRTATGSNTSSSSTTSIVTPGNQPEPTPTYPAGGNPWWRKQVEIKPVKEFERVPQIISSTIFATALSSGVAVGQVTWSILEDEAELLLLV